MQFIPIYYQNNNISVHATHRPLRLILKSAELVIPATMDLFLIKFTLVDNAHTESRLAVYTEDAIAVVEQSVENPRMSPSTNARSNWSRTHSL